MTNVTKIVCTQAYQAISPPMANSGRNSTLQQPLLIAPAVEDQYLTPSWSPDIQNSVQIQAPSSSPWVLLLLQLSKVA